MTHPKTAWKTSRQTTHFPRTIGPFLTTKCLRQKFESMTLKPFWIVHRATSDSLDRSGRKRISPRDDWRIRESYLLWVLFIGLLFDRRNSVARDFGRQWLCHRGANPILSRNWGLSQKFWSMPKNNGTIQYGIVNIYPPKPKELANSTCNLCWHPRLRLWRWAIFVQLLCN